jgi:hypothetical protein
MEKFSADMFFYIAKYLADIRAIFAAKEPTFEFATIEEGSSGDKTLQGIADLCTKTGLRVSAKAVQHIMNLTRKKTGAGIYKEAITQLERTIKWEMEDKLFMFIPPDRAAYYDKSELFGESVNSKFSTVQFDVVEAGNCYASGRSTAAVFHLMRIMEIGVQSLEQTLGVALVQEKNWQNILDEINKKVKALLQKDPKTVRLSQCCANLYAVKLAWRNEVMHPKETYTLEEADNLIRQVKLFMEQLATIV